MFKTACVCRERDCVCARTNLHHQFTVLVFILSVLAKRQHSFLFFFFLQNFCLLCEEASCSFFLSTVSLPGFVQVRGSHVETETGLELIAVLKPTEQGCPFSFGHVAY